MFEDITRISKMAKLASKADKNVINATMGVLNDDNGNVIYSHIFDELISTLEINDKYPYENVGGADLLNQNLLSFINQENISPLDNFTMVTPGGTGALSCLFSVFSKKAGLVLSSLCWSNYLLIAKLNNISIHSYNMFKDNSYDTISFEQSLKESLKQNENTIVLLNTPSHNPTGYDITPSELKEIVNIINRNYQSDKKVTLILDIAYYNFGKFKDFSSIKNLNSNVNLAIVYSFSKSLGLYGLRLGTLTLFSKDCDRLKNETLSYARGTWSSPNKLACSIVEKIFTNDDYLSQVYEEIDHHKLILSNRSSLFIKKLKDAGIKNCPYMNGFFVTIEVNDPEFIATKLAEIGTYVTTISSAIRVAISGVPTQVIERLAENIIKVIKEYN